MSRRFYNGALKREEIWTYRAVCETAQDEQIEYFRDKLLQIIEEVTQASDALNRKWKTVGNFKTRFRTLRD